MSVAEQHHGVLSKDLMTLQLGQIDLLMAMYASDNAVTIGTTGSETVEALRSWCEGDEETVPELSETGIDILLDLDVADAEDGSPGETGSLQLHLSVPLVYQDENTELDCSTEPPPVKARIQQAAWMSKGEIAQLNTDMPDGDMLTVIEHVKEAALEHLTTSLDAGLAHALTDADPSEVVRVWFYFPSISTRSKRDDLVHHAPTYGLTGFLLAGKPGLLCLEGDSTAIDRFMRFIKTESWGDIPPQHKKVSERYREEGGGVRRAFAGMCEVTDELGERRGERANRGDMKALEAWLGERGLGEAFGKVLM